MKTRIELSDTVIEMVTKISEGNPGAMNVVVRMLERGAIIDPDDFLGNLGGLLQLDTFNIYGSRIWMLYKDVCGQDIVNTLGMLRAVQLGIINLSALNAAIDGRGTVLDVENTMHAVRERLPAFGKSNA